MSEPIRTERNRNRLGFTMMELLTVIVIISVVMATGVVSYVGARRGMEMRSAASSIQSTLALARQHAVSKRRTTCIVFRGENGTNCYYVFEKNGNAILDHATRLETTTPPASGTLPASNSLVCNMSTPKGSIGKIPNFGGNYGVAGGVVYFTSVTWLPTEAGGWKIGDSYGFQVSEKMYLPPGISCQIDNQDNALITFYANGRGTGVNRRTIKLTDKLGSVVKTFSVYPLVGLVK